jgi:large subunit ribosomal protein L24
MHKIKKGDEVIVITGRDKGKTGSVTEVLEKGEFLLVDGINTVKKHVKANPNSGDRGGIVIKVQPIRASNVKLYNAATQKGSRVGIRVLDDGRKVRFYKSTNEVVDIDV